MNMKTHKMKKIFVILNINAVVHPVMVCEMILKIRLG